MPDEPTETPAAQPEPAEKPKTAVKAKAPQRVLVATVQPYQRFNPLIDGVSVLTNAPTPVPAGALAAVHQAALAAAVELKEL